MKNFYYVCQVCVAVGLGRKFISVDLKYYCCRFVSFCNVFNCGLLLFYTMSVGSVISTSNEQRFELGISPSCCRSLFGPIDHAQLRAELETELRRIAEEKKRRWNFDFVKVEPLDGDFLWQRIGESRSVGLSTSEDQVTAETHDRITPQHSSCSSMHAESNTKSSNRNTFSGQTNCFNTPEQLPVKRRRKSPRITGISEIFFQTLFCTKPL